MTLVIRGNDWVDGRILEMVLIHRSWVWAIRTPGKRLGAEWERRKVSLQPTFMVQCRGNTQDEPGVDRYREHYLGISSSSALVLEFSSRTSAQAKVFELDGNEPENQPEK
ncbi:hypothetical protein B0H16DRAFT_1474456 [Mycena metata]|uniref:Uncharacterized protein n=1 Tax=Mycena metata TaxID=1033252 RepID=A0AAD7MJE7_9AGAR|nr:hypothetical protein B0H16DRAFT_1474456 [Mycena metata]